jgi:hypothetical protein
MLPSDHLFFILDAEALRLRELQRPQQDAIRLQEKEALRRTQERNAEAAPLTTTMTTTRPMPPKEDKNDDITALSEDLFIRFADLELQDAAALAQRSDALALEALAKIANPLTLPAKWTTEKDPNGATCLF